LELPATIKNRKRLSEETEILYELSKNIPRLIAESYGDRFNNFIAAIQKLEHSMRLISDAIAKIDFLMLSIKNQGAGGDLSEELGKLLKNYQVQRRKILNLKNAWERVFRE